MVKISDLNKKYYERVWGKYDLLDYRLWSTSPIIQRLKYIKALEIGCGNKPRIPVRGNCFLDINSQAVEKLKIVGGKAKVFDLKTKFPFKDGEFGLVCAFEVLEHLQNFKKIISEMSRVLSNKGTMMVSFPINMKYFVKYDEVVGHFQRFEPAGLSNLFDKAGLKIERYSPVKVTWPTVWQSSILVYLAKRFPSIISAVQNWLETREGSVLRRELNLKKWSSRSMEELKDETTALFILRKKWLK